MSLVASAIRFDADQHQYTDVETGAVLPHITEMLERTGWIDDTWYTEESCERGKQIHRLTAAYDLGALDVASVVSDYRGYLLGHLRVMDAIRPTWLYIEVPIGHPKYRFGGRPDRVGTALSLRTILEIKSGVFQKSHMIQTALQAILVAADGGLPAEYYQRLGEYLKPNGRVKLEQFKSRSDLDEAYRIIRECCK